MDDRALEFPVLVRATQDTMPLMPAIPTALPRALGIEPGHAAEAAVRIAIVQDGAYQPHLWIPPSGPGPDIVATIHASMPPHCFSGWGGDLDCLVLDLSPEPGAGTVDLGRARDLAQRSLLVVLSERIDVRLSACLFDDDEMLILPRPLGPSEAQLMLRGFAKLVMRRRLPAQAAPGGIRDRPANAAVTTTPLAPGIQVDFDNRVLHVGNQPVPLRRGESDLLRYLHDNQHNWSSTERIRKHVFNREDPAGLTLVWKYASELRRKLGDEQEVLQTSRTRGYRLVTFAARSLEDAPAAGASVAGGAGQ